MKKELKGVKGAEDSQGTGLKGLHGLGLFVRSGRVWQLINQILRGGCGGEGSSQVVQRSKGLWVY
jgi:hypothetical protein